MSRGRSRGPSLRDLAGGVRFSGGVAELYANGLKVGLAFDYEMAGRANEFRFEAERYKLDPKFFKGNRIKVRLDIGRGRLEAAGAIWGEPIADGHIHDGFMVKGGNLRWLKQAAAPPQSKQQHRRTVA